jgi:TRAP-type C4-dicarboxylate transport system permease small subunit
MNNQRPLPPLTRRALLLVAALSATFIALILFLGGFIMYTQAIAAEIPSSTPASDVANKKIPKQPPQQG